MKHTETPWAIRDLEIIGPYKSNKSICEMTRAFMNEDEQKENIRHIVHCVNTHDELVKALQEWLKVINRSDAALYHYGDAIKMTENILQKVTDTTPINQ